MYKLLITLLILFVLYACQKDDPINENPGNNITTTHHNAYFQGIITDSTTGLPLSGYNVRVYGPSASLDTLIDGTYLLHVYWYEGKLSYPKPSMVHV
ncbi:hypothetical protein SAMN05216474_1833 [Lishizhenia tianjinensis]|uniref:Carboxypeptidase regulatory-like domain-containing protein n=1 Tax=Lishizhenia tianjinensis TaxID=477690 RepID=A0A1I7A2A5_9FLAO|nr:hypothetical protein [Lishizhenia tianjinensis]SFT69042.1 hypothetical protein SAMN05216474_1833 [Lishizhenia tianjinensis]